MRTDTYEDLADLVSKALTRAWSLGQIYWQQADSEYASQWKKSDETQAKFNQLVEETRAVMLSAAQDHPATAGDAERFESLARAVMADHTYHDTLTARVAELEAALARVTVAVQEEQ